MNEKKMAIIEKIQKCLLLAKNQEGTPESDSAKRRAALLMAKYRIEETEIDLETDSFTLDVFEYNRDGKDVPQWVGRCVQLFAHVFDTQIVFRGTWEGKEWEIIGTFSDVETTLYFVEVATHHIAEACWKTWPNKKNWRKRQQLGNEAVSALWERAYELKQQMDSTIHEDTGCTALVVQKKNEIDNAVNEMYPNLRKSKGHKVDYATDEKTRSAGQKAGKSCPLNLAVE